MCIVKYEALLFISQRCKTRVMAGGLLTASQGTLLNSKQPWSSVANLETFFPLNLALNSH